MKIRIRLFLVLAFLAYSEPVLAEFAPFPLDMSGVVKYSINKGKINLHIERVDNPNEITWRSGSIKFQIWATKKKYSGGNIKGYPLLSCYRFDGLDGKTYMDNPKCPGRLLPRISSGSYYISVTISNFVDDENGYLIEDFVTFPKRLKYTDKLRTTAKEQVKAD